MGVDCYLLRCDFEAVDAAERLVQEAWDALGRVHVLVNNVAVLTRTPFIDIRPAELERVLNVNLQAPFFLTQGVARRMIDAGLRGSIINISSLSAERARSRVAHYQCSKAALNMLSKSVAYELAPHGIRVNTLAPGLTATRANRDQWEGAPATWRARCQDIPLGRAGSAEDHAGAAVYLASDESVWTTGAHITIDGGMSAF